MWTSLLLVSAPWMPFWTALAAAATDPSSDQWTQIGVGALIALPAYAVVAVLWKDRGRKDAEIKTLNDKATSRERELADRLVPLLTEAARVLASATTQFDQSARASADHADIDRVVTRLTRVIDDLERGQDGQ